MLPTRKASTLEDLSTVIKATTQAATLETLKPEVEVELKAKEIRAPTAGVGHRQLGCASL